MGRKLRWLGSILILVTVALWIAGAAAMIPETTDDHWSSLTLKAGMIALAGALLLRLLTPVAGVMRSGRCAVCGHPTERKHTYCLDHLQETVNAHRDLSRNRTLPRPKALP
jgi:predicted nucleic acid-binding Zn ribbon protein